MHSLFIRFEKYEVQEKIAFPYCILFVPG